MDLWESKLYLTLFVATPSYKPSAKFQEHLDENCIAEELKRLGIDKDVDVPPVDDERISQLANNLEEGSFEDLFSQFQEMKSNNHCLKYSQCSKSISNR